MRGDLTPTLSVGQSKVDPYRLWPMTNFAWIAHHAVSPTNLLLGMYSLVFFVCFFSWAKSILLYQAYSCRIYPEDYKCISYIWINILTVCPIQMNWLELFNLFRDDQLLNCFLLAVDLSYSNQRLAVFRYSAELN